MSACVNILMSCLKIKTSVFIVENYAEYMVFIDYKSFIKQCSCSLLYLAKICFVTCS